MPTTDAAGKFYGLPYGQVILDMGPAGTGKSHFLASVCEVVPPEKVLLFVTSANEASSYGYRKYGLSERAEMFIDSGWDPELDMFKATAFKALRKRLREVATMPVATRPHALLIDSGTNVGLLKSNEILAGMKMPDGKIPGNVGAIRTKGAKDASFSYYDQMKSEMQRFIMQCVEMAVTAPMFVLISWHIQAINESETAVAGTAFEGRTLPMIEGGYRQKLAGDVDVVVYSDIKRTVVDGKPTTQYVIQLAATNERHTKVRSIPASATADLPNSFKALHDLMKGV